MVLAVVDDDEFCDPPDISDPPASRTSPMQQLSSPSPHSPSPHPMRERALAQRRPVSIPDIVGNMAGKHPIQKIAEFDQHYMPDGQPAPEASVRGNADSHRSGLKRKAEDMSRSLSEVFAYLTHGTTSLAEAKNLLTIITNVMYIIVIIHIIVIICIMTIMYH